LIIYFPSSKGNSNWNGDLGSGLAMSCLVRKPLACRAFNRVGGALYVVDAKLLAIVHAEIKFRG
jgi:hypothetical protein